MTDISVYYANWIGSDPEAPDATYRLVHECVISPDPSPAGDRETCEIMFMAMNRGSGREMPALDEKALRSMSVNDIVKLRDAEDSDYAEHARLKAEGKLPEPCGPSCPRPRLTRAYRCAPTGWEPVESWTMAEAVTP